jgi:hypothetical protein
MKAEGFVPSRGWSGKPVTRVRRLLPSFVKGLENLRRRKEIEKEHGPIDTGEWNQLREMLALLDRLNAGDLSPSVSSNAEEALAHLPALLDRLSPGGWYRDESKNGELSFIPASGDGRLTIELGKATRTPLADAPSAHKTVKQAKPATERDGVTKWSIEISGERKAVTFALSEAFTIGLSKTRFVVWWSDVGKKLVPGLYCPDIVTALYALAMWSSGTAGGWAICQNEKCVKDYPRRRAKQLYCSHKCQVAVGMRRYRENLERAAKPKSKTTTKSKKRTGRK